MAANVVMKSEQARVADCLHAANLDPALQSPALTAALSEHGRRYGLSILTAAVALSAHTSPIATNASYVKRVTADDVRLAVELQGSAGERGRAPSVDKLHAKAEVVNARPLPAPRGPTVVPLPSRNNCLARCYDVTVREVKEEEGKGGEKVVKRESEESSKKVKKQKQGQKKAVVMVDDLVAEA